ncbi:MAG: glycosyl hydrolase 108 family protein, partial [Armatimonadota bacterium]
FGREWDQPSDEQKWMAGLLGIKDPKKLNVYNSPESYFLTRAVQDWNAKKAGMSMSFFEPSDPRMNDDLMKYVIDAEGDKAENHRFDFGKSTKYGISTKDKERLAKYGLSIGDIPNLSYLQAKQFYKDEYWNKPYTVGLPPPKDVQNKRLAIVLFDTAINGVGPIGPPLRSIYNDTTLTDDQKADAMMTLRLKFYKKYGQAFGRTPEEKAKNLAMAQIGWHNRIIKKLWPYVGHDPDKVQQ